jgi:hypothetical protein
VASKCEITRVPTLGHLDVTFMERHKEYHREQGNGLLPSLLHENVTNPN